MPAQTFQPIAARRAPVRVEGPIGWLRVNLFSDWKTSLATVIIGALLLWVEKQVNKGKAR